MPAVPTALAKPQAVKQVVESRWSRTAEPNLSYDEAVRLYLEKYYRKSAGADYDFLFPVLRPPV
jgi:hypothetical protein